MDRFHPKSGPSYPPKSASDPTLHIYSQLTYLPRVEIRYWKGSDKISPLPAVISEAASKICKRLDGLQVTCLGVPVNDKTAGKERGSCLSDSQVNTTVFSNVKSRSRFGLMKYFKRQKNRKEADRLAVKNFKEKNKKSKKSKGKCDNIQVEHPIEALNDAIYKAMFPIYCRTQGMDFDHEYYHMFKMNVIEMPQMESIYEFEELDSVEMVEEMNPEPEDEVPRESKSRLKRFRKMASQVFRRILRITRA